MKISVIVPVYKVEKYIEKCIQSLLDQTYTNFEALIVDDGSPDQSISIAKKLVGNDPRFVFLEKENGGLSSARNYGLDHATGEYIYFLDSDDYITNNAFEKCISYFKNDPSIDIVIFGINWVTTTGKTIKRTLPNLDNYYQKNDILLTLGSILYSVWSKMYKAELWREKRFIEGIIYEDKEITPSILYKNKIIMIDDYLYNYTQRAGSIMNSYNEVSLKSMLTIYKSYKKLLKDKKIYTKYKKYYKKSYINFCYFSESIRLLNYSNNLNFDYKKLERELDKKIFNIRNIFFFFIFSKKFYFYLLMKISPAFTLKIFNIMKK